MQRSVKRVTLEWVPLDVVCGVVVYFEHVEELKCEYIKNPQQVCMCIFYIPVGVVDYVCRVCQLIRDNTHLLPFISKH